MSACVWRVSHFHLIMICHKKPNALKPQLVEKYLQILCTAACKKNVTLHVQLFRLNYFSFLLSLFRQRRLMAAGSLSWPLRERDCLTLVGVLSPLSTAARSWSTPTFPRHTNCGDGEWFFPLSRIMQYRQYTLHLLLSVCPRRDRCVLMRSCFYFSTCENWDEQRADTKMHTLELREGEHAHAFDIEISSISGALVGFAFRLI